jgi:hypothetical protein
MLCGIEAKKLNESENRSKDATKSKNKVEAKKQTDQVGGQEDVFGGQESSIW